MRVIFRKFQMLEFEQFAVMFLWNITVKKLFSSLLFLFPILYWITRIKEKNKLHQNLSNRFYTDLVQWNC